LFLYCLPKGLSFSSEEKETPGKEKELLSQGREWKRKAPAKGQRQVDSLAGSPQN